MKDPQQIIELLEWTGHLRNPLGKPSALPKPVGELTLADECVQRAVASYQDFLAVPLERLCSQHHQRAAYHDGVIGPATEALFDAPRCGHPDYGPEAATLPLVGTGNWPRCHGIGEFHAATVDIKPGMPSHVAPLFDAIWERTRKCYDAIGLRLIRRDGGSGGNISFEFVTRSNGWIGLAIVGQGQSCSGKIWCRYLATWRPSNVLSEWTTLVIHELGHNVGLGHTRGGIMNPSLLSGLAPTWRGDPAEAQLRRWYGGVPVPDDDLLPDWGSDQWL